LRVIGYFQGGGGPSLACAAVLFASSTSTAKRRALIFAALFLAALCAVAGSWAGSAPADPRDKMEATRDKLEDVRAEESDLAATIAEQNRAIDSLLGEVSALRQEQEAVEAELAAKQAELDRATAALEAEEAHLERVRAQLGRALDLLGDRLVAIYESGSPDTLDAVLESEDWSEMTAQTEYLREIQEYDDAVVDRVKTLRNEVRTAVERLDEQRAEIEAARDAIAAKEREVRAASQEANARFLELKAAQAERQGALEELQSREAALSDNLSAISEQIASEGGDATEGSMPAPLNPGQEAELISESEASAPASAPQAVKEVIAAANAIATTPYIWGGGHGSFESSGYDCSGAVSYALHGGGLLESPLDSTGLTTWGEPGPGRWITVYGNSGHAWMVIAGLAFDTSGGAGPRWHDPWPNSPEGFIARHPAGL
jgi:septal ring factor EnvC (AmiA/AmiB activator)